MSNRHNKDAKLLAGVFHDDWAHGPAASFARAAAAHARRRRVMQRVLATSAATVVVVLSALIVSRSAKPTPRRPSSEAISSVRGYEIISDDELLSQLHDRPVLAVKRADGTQQIVLL